MYTGNEAQPLSAGWVIRLDDLGDQALWLSTPAIVLNSPEELLIEGENKPVQPPASCLSLRVSL